jgi:hypothetical protein
MSPAVPSLVVALVVLLPAPLPAQDRPAAPPEWANYGKPGAEHERLKALVGTWSLTVDGEQTKGRAVYKAILGGRFLTEEVKLPFSGMPFEWLGVYGFDKQKKKYTAVWVDNLDTNTEAAEGDADATGKVITLRGQHPDPRSGKMASFVWRISRDGDNKLTIEMLEADATGRERKVLAVRGERVK